MITLLNLLLAALLLLLLRKLVWCLRALWHMHRGEALPKAQSFLPRQSGDVFSGHIRSARENRGDLSPEPAETPEDMKLE